MVTPAIENIENFDNDVEITFIGSFVSVGAMKNHPNTLKTVILDKKYSVLYKTAKDLGNFDAFFSFKSSTRSKFLKFCVSAKSKYQFDKNKHINCHQVKIYNNVVNDSGPMHVTAAFQVPTVAIFGPTKDDETSQWMNDKSIIVKKNLDCQPCIKRTCPLKHHECMKLVSAVEVLDAFRGLS